MVSLASDSLYFIAFLVLAPFVLRNNYKYRRIVFLILNLGVVLAGMSSVLQLAVSAAWVIIPYAVCRFMLRLEPDKREKLNWRRILIPVMVICFAYLMKYNIIFDTLRIKYIFAFRILGLSYFLFRQIDFILQLDYLSEEGIRISFVDYLNYLLSFYTLLAGPILRYEEFVQDFYSEVSPVTRDEVFKNLNRALNGYIKVYVISALLGYYAGRWFDGLTAHGSVITTAAAFVIFALFNGWYIYFNFSGYCDIVIAFAALSGLKVHENFNQPYLARSVVEFWNRHHITLSEWIRDYLFSPMFKGLLSGPCESNVKLGQYIALFLTFTIAGIWHGTDLNYLIYGLFQGLGIVVATAWKAERKKLLGKERNKKYEKSQVAVWIGRCVTWTYISLTFSFVGYDVVSLIAGK